MLPASVGTVSTSWEGKVIVVRAPQEQKSGIQDGPPVEAQLGSLLQYEDGEVTLLPLQARP